VGGEGWLSAGWVCDADWRMSGDWEDDLCKKALALVEELCFQSGGFSQSESCREFIYLMRRPNRQMNTGKNTANPIKGMADPKISILSSFTRLHVVTNQYGLLSCPRNTKEDV